MGGGMLAPMSSSSRLLAAGGLILVLAGCGVGQPAPYPPQGVDALEIPTPSPRANDFAQAVDHPFMRLDDGARWEYLLRDGSDPIASLERAVTGSGRVAGVPVTWVSVEVSAAASTVEDAVWRDAYAQDRAGNVWWFAREGTAADFEAGVDGAEAGLVLPASFRVGDSYEMRSLGTDTAEWTRIDATDVRLGTAMGDLEGLVQTSGTAFSGVVDGRDSAEARRWFAPGLGMVQEERYDGRVLRLVLHDAGE